MPVFAFAAWMKRWSIAWSTELLMDTASPSPTTCTVHWKTLFCTIACTRWHNTMTLWMFGSHIRYMPNLQPRLRNTQRNTNLYRLQTTRRECRPSHRKCNPTAEKKTQRTCLLYPARMTASRCNVWSFALQWDYLSFAMGISRNEVEPDLECQLQLYCFGFIERDCSKLLYFLLLFVLHLLPFARQKQWCTDHI